MPRSLLDPLEVADHVHTEVPPWAEETARPSAARNTGLHALFNERVESGFPKQVLQAIVERVSLASAASPPTSPSDRPEPPPIALIAIADPPASASTTTRKSAELDFVNGLLTVPNTWDELIADVPKFKAAGYIPLAWGNLTRNTCPDFFLPLVAQYGGDVYALDDHTAPGLSSGFEASHRCARAATTPRQVGRFPRRYQRHRRPSKLSAGLSGARRHVLWRVVDPEHFPARRHQGLA